MCGVDMDFEWGDLTLWSSKLDFCGTPQILSTLLLGMGWQKLKNEAIMAYV